MRWSKRNEMWWADGSNRDSGKLIPSPHQPITPPPPPPLTPLPPPPDPRDALPSSPHTATEGADLFGMARRVDPRPVGSGGPRARVLVCAPSNSALDEVVVRVMQQGLLAPDGTAFTPGEGRGERGGVV